MPAPTTPTPEDDDALDVFGAPDPFEADILAALRAQQGDDGEDDVGFGPVELPDEPSRPVYTEQDGQRIAADARRAAEEARPTKPVEQPKAAETATDEDKAAPGQEKAAQPAPADEAWLTEIPEAHRGRVTQAIEHARVTEQIMPLAIARGIPAAQVPAAVKTLVELNDFANRDLVGYFAHVAGLTGNNAADKAEGLVKALADKLGVKLAPEAKKDDPGYDPAEEDEDDAFESPKVKALTKQVADLQKLVTDQQGRVRDEQGRFASPAQAQQPPAPQAQPEDPAIEQRMTAIRAFVDEKAEDGRPLRPHWDSLWQGGYIAAAIQQMRAKTGATDLQATPENLSIIYRDALLLNPATRDQALEMMQAARATPRPTTGQPQQRGRAAAKIIDVGQGAAKPAMRGSADDLDGMLSEAIRTARVA